MLEEIESEFLEEIQIITQVLMNHERNIDFSQKHIILRQRIKTLLNIVNKIYQLENYSVEEKSKLLEKFISKLNQILNLCRPDENCYDINYYNLFMIQLSMISGLMQSWGELGRLRAIGSANLLAQILTGLEIEPIEQIIPDISQLSFEETYRLVFNYINILGGCYYIASCQLYCIDSASFIQWCRFALDANQRLLFLIDKYWSDPNLRDRIDYAKKNRTLNSFHESYYTHQNVYTQMIKWLLLMDARYGGTWPDSFNSVEFLSFNTRFAFLNSICRLHREISLLQARIDFYHPFAQPLQSTYPKTVQMRIEISHLVEKAILLIERTLHFYNHPSNCDENHHNLIKNIDEFWLQFQKFILKYQMKMSHPRFITSSIAEYWGEQFLYVLAIVGLNAKLKQSLEPLQEFERLLSPFFINLNYLKYPLFSGLFYTIKLTITLELSQFENIEYFIFYFFQLSAHTPYQARDVFTFYLLGSMLKFALNLIQKEEFFNNMFQKLAEIQEHLHPAMYQQMHAYLLSLKHPLNEESIYHVKNISALSTDPHTIFIPDFQFLFEQFLHPNAFPFFPFNLRKDAIH